MNIVGISSHFHDAACCLLRDGQIVAAAEEERFSRIKHDPRIPLAAFKFCLERGGLSPADIDVVAYYEDPNKKLARQLWFASPVLPLRQVNSPFNLDPCHVERDIRQILGFSGALEFVDHHIAHAASSFFFSGFKESAILTVDAVGEWTTTSLGIASGNTIDLLEQVEYPHSIGIFYSTITAFLGFEVNEGEYKVMGLAPYGQPVFVERLRQLFADTSAGNLQLNLEYFDFPAFKTMYTEKLGELLQLCPRMPESELNQTWCDLARSAQVLLEEILLEKVRYLGRIATSENLCMAGGVALNCVANGRIHREGPFKRLFIQPAAGDSGGALGAAAYVHAQRAGPAQICKPITNVFWGPSFTTSDIERVFKGSIIKPDDFRNSEEDLLGAVAKRLEAGRIVGWFHGAMEFGPRALGGRSILADPRPPGMKDKINEIIKQRESFRPFAPAVLAEDAALLFELAWPSPFMLETVQVLRPDLLRATTHNDNSARVQTVDKLVQPRFHKLLAAFKKLTGCPVLLNTSFNVRGEPIVCTPYDALLCFLRSGLDTLVLEDFVLDREMLTPELLSWFSGTSPNTSSGIQHTVYTFL